MGFQPGTYRFQIGHSNHSAKLPPQKNEQSIMQCFLFLKTDFVSPFFTGIVWLIPLANVYPAFLDLKFSFHATKEDYEQTSGFASRHLCSY